MNFFFFLINSSYENKQIKITQVRINMPVIYSSYDAILENAIRKFKKHFMQIPPRFPEENFAVSQKQVSSKIECHDEENTNYEQVPYTNVALTAQENHPLTLMVNNYLIRSLSQLATFVSNDKE